MSYLEWFSITSIVGIIIIFIALGVFLWKMEKVTMEHVAKTIRKFEGSENKNVHYDCFVLGDPGSMDKDLWRSYLDIFRNLFITVWEFKEEFPVIVLNNNWEKARGNSVYHALKLIEYDSRDTTGSPKEVSVSLIFTEYIDNEISETRRFDNISMSLITASNDVSIYMVRGEENKNQEENLAIANSLKHTFKN